MSGNQKSLPLYPKVTVRNKAIVIQFADGSEDTWGHEPNPEIATAIAGDIELGLKAIDYTFHEISDKLDKLVFDLVELGVPMEYTDDIIFEGYCKIQKWFRKIQPHNIIA